MPMLSRSMQRVAQLFPDGSGGITSMPQAAGGMGRLMGALAGGFAGGGSTVSAPPTGAPAQSVMQTPAVDPASLQPGTGGTLGQLSRAQNDNDADDTLNARLIDAIRNGFPQSARAAGASPLTRPTSVVAL